MWRGTILLLHVIVVARTFACLNTIATLRFRSVRERFRTFVLHHIDDRHFTVGGRNRSRRYGAGRNFFIFALVATRRRAVAGASGNGDGHTGDSRGRGCFRILTHFQC